MPATHFSRCSGLSAGACATPAPPHPPLPGLWSEAPPQAGSGGLSIPTVACRAGRRAEGQKAVLGRRGVGRLRPRACCWAGRGLLEDANGRWR